MGIYPIPRPKKIKKELREHEKHAIDLVNYFADMVMKHNDKPILEAQKYCATKVIIEQIKICKMFNLIAQKEYLLKVRDVIYNM